MKKSLKNIVSFSMVLILLGSTLQFSVYKMECLMTGNTLVSLSEFDDCDKKSKNDCSFSEQCCDFNDITFDFDFDTNIGVRTFKSLNAQPIIAEQNCVISTEIVTKNVSANFYTNLPPPSGYELIKLVQVFRI